MAGRCRAVVASSRTSPGTISPNSRRAGSARSAWWCSGTCGPGPRPATTRPSCPATFWPTQPPLCVTAVTGDGRLVRSGGRVVKNVAGYDLTKLEAGGFGAFGVIVLVHLRLRALPRADQTFVLEGTREDLTQVAEDIAAAGLQPAALELMSPALARREGWALAVRLAGSAALVAAEEAGLRGARGGRFTALRADGAHA